MKKILIIIMLFVGGWNYYQKNNTVEQSISTFSLSDLYSCDGRQHCSQMSSYDEAKYFLDHCPHTKMDGDRDGIPCERQFH